MECELASASESCSEPHYSAGFRVHHAPFCGSADAFEDAPGDRVIIDVAKGLRCGVDAEAEFDHDSWAVEALGGLAFEGRAV